MHGRAWRGGEKREGEKGDSFEGSPTLEDHVNGRSAVRGARWPEVQRLEEVQLIAERRGCESGRVGGERAGEARAESEGEGEAAPRRVRAAAASAGVERVRLEQREDSWAPWWKLLVRKRRRGRKGPAEDPPESEKKGRERLDGGCPPPPTFRCAAALSPFSLLSLSESQLSPFPRAGHPSARAPPRAGRAFPRAPPALRYGVVFYP